MIVDCESAPSDSPAHCCLQCAQRRRWLRAGHSRKARWTQGSGAEPCVVDGRCPLRWKMPPTTMRVMRCPSAERPTPPLAPPWTPARPASPTTALARSAGEPGPRVEPWSPWLQALLDGPLPNPRCAVEREPRYWLAAVHSCRPRQRSAPHASASSRHAWPPRGAAATSRGRCLPAPRCKCTLFWRAVPRARGPAAAAWHTPYSRARPPARSRARACSQRQAQRSLGIIRPRLWQEATGRKRSSRLLAFNPSLGLRRLPWREPNKFTSLPYGNRMVTICVSSGRLL